MEAELVEELRFSGKKVVFTGRLASMTRDEAVDLVVKRGALHRTVVSRQTDYLVVGMLGWNGRYRESHSNKYDQAVRLRESSTAGLRITSELEFLEALGLRKPRKTRGTRIHVDEVAELVAIPEELLTLWFGLSLIRADPDGFIDLNDMIALRALTFLDGDEIPIRHLHEFAAELESRVTPGTNPLSVLLTAEAVRGCLLARIGGVIVEKGGQHQLDFDEECFEPATIRISDYVTPESTGGESTRMRSVEESLEIYRREIVLSPDSASGYYNLANQLAAIGKLESAEQIYRLALLLEPSNVNVMFNLADTLHRRSNTSEASELLRDIISQYPTFADAYYNLAAYELRLGNAESARENWSRYLAFDLDSQWSTEARAQLRKLASAIS
ncbi:MAG: tetratricopeptide repeat protein [Planctomycetota bacterium]